MADLKLYNTLTRQKEVFAPADPKNVRMYVCGPTVYDYAHIGNARPAIVFDVLFRLLRHLYGEEHVTYVRNITDVDDKINARARRDFPDLPLNEAIARVTQPTTAQYHKDVEALGCLKPTHEPHATEHIPGMVEMIQTLIDKGNAYVAVGAEGREVLFEVDSMPDYGALSKRKLEDQQAGARVAVEAHKKNPADFVLWKESSADEPGWDAHFLWAGDRVAIFGRPGWHLECSVMSKAHLGEVFDIHGGGLDLIFPHHENEIAQSRCAHGTKVMASVWMHNGFLQVEGRKMAKSEGNFVTIDNLLSTHLGFVMFNLRDNANQESIARRWNGLGARLAMLQTHYRAPIDWTAARHTAARSEVIEWHEKLKAIGFQFGLDYRHAPNVAEALSEDLNTPQAIAHLRDAANSGSLRTLGEGMDLLGLFDHGLMNRYDLLTEQLDAPIKDKVDRRLALIREKNFAEADQIREDLAAQGIQLMDYKDPETGERKTKWEVKR